jgi:hypothetical protein
VRDHLTRQVERFAPSGRPRAAGWTRQAAQLFTGQVVLGGLDGLTRGMVAGPENSSPSQGDLVVGPLFVDVRSIAKHEMKVIVHHGIATNLDSEEPCLLTHPVENPILAVAKVLPGVGIDATEERGIFLMPLAAWTVRDTSRPSPSSIRVTLSTDAPSG